MHRIFALCVCFLNSFLFRIASSAPRESELTSRSEFEAGRPAFVDLRHDVEELQTWSVAGEGSSKRQECSNDLSKAVTHGRESLLQTRMDASSTRIDGSGGSKLKAAAVNERDGSEAQSFVRTVAGRLFVTSGRVFALNWTDASAIHFPFFDFGRSNAKNETGASAAHSLPHALTIQLLQHLGRLENGHSVTGVYLSAAISLLIFCLIMCAFYGTYSIVREYNSKAASSANEAAERDVRIANLRTRESLLRTRERIGQPQPQHVQPDVFVFGAAAPSKPPVRCSPRSSCGETAEVESSGRGRRRSQPRQDRGESLVVGDTISNMAQLCPHLNLSRDHDSVLLIEITQGDITAHGSTISIVDQEGVPKMSATVRTRSQDNAGAPIISLCGIHPLEQGGRSWNHKHGNIIASCRGGFKVNHRPCTYIYTRSDELFGTFVLDTGPPECYVFTSAHRGTMMFFEGRYSDRQVMVNDVDNNLLADTRPCESFEQGRFFYRVRAAPGSDVGLIVCCLLSIEHLECALGTDDGH